MTNYNERRDEIFETLNNKAREERASCTERKNWEGYNSAYERLEHDAKQAITSLIKELVAEAKPRHLSDTSGYHEDFTPEQLTRITAANRASNEAVKEFEQNLLKALEEKKYDRTRTTQ